MILAELVIVDVWMIAIHIIRSLPVFMQTFVYSRLLSAHILTYPRASEECMILLFEFSRVDSKSKINEKTRRRLHNFRNINLKDFTLKNLT